MASTALQPTTIPTFREYGELILDRREEQGIRGITRERSRWRCHIEMASFASKPINEITSRDIRDWLRLEMQTKFALTKGPNAKPTDKPLDPTTISRAQSLVSAIFVEAVEADLCESNPCIGVKQKKRVGETDTVRKCTELTEAEQLAIINCDAIDRKYKLAIRFAIETGMRQAEQMNLELPDLIVDGPEPRAIIRYSNPRRLKDGTIQKMPPKSGKIREVPLVGDALAVAKEWLEFLPTFCPENPLNLVFPTERGKRRNQGKPLGRSMTHRKVYELAGIEYRKGLHWHALRHTFGTNLVSGAFGRKPRRKELIQSLMGHSSVTVTERYAKHRTEDVRRELLEGEETAIAPAIVVPSEVVPAPAAAPLALVIPELTPIERLAFGIVGAASKLATMIKGSSRVA